MRYAKPVWPLLILLAIAPLAVSCGSSASAEVDGYVALVPRVFRPNETESVSLSLFAGEKLANGSVNVALLRDGDAVAEGSAVVKGKGTVELEVPALDGGDYEVVVSGPGFEDATGVLVRPGTLVFLETDKPIYKPGQTIMMRVVALNSELKPVPVAEATVEAQDAKGARVFRQTVATDEFGTATLELPLSTEPNLGVWKLSAAVGEAATEVDVRVEEYVLPKYEVSVDLPQEWFLVDDRISGKVSAQYSFGKPVKGELLVKASRYVGVWEEFATFTAPIDGEGEFSIEPAGYVAGVPEAGGLGNVTLDVSVVERATGYEEKTTQMVTVAAAPLNVQLIPESTAFKPSLPFNVLVVAETPDGQPVEASVNVNVSYFDEDYSTLGSEDTRVETQRGTGLLRLTAPAGALRMMLSAYSGDAYAYKEVAAGYSPSGNFIHVEQTEPALYRVGDEARFKVSSTAEARSFYYEVVARDRVVFTGHSETPDIIFTTTPAMAPSAKLLVYQLLPTTEVAADFIPFDVEGDYPLDVTASFSAEEVAPGDEVSVDVQTDGPAKVGLVAVDHSVFILAENRLNLQQVFAELERLYGEPQAELHEVEQFGPIVIPGAEETFKDAGLSVLSNKRVPKGKELEQPVFFGFGGAAAADAEGGPVIMQRANDALAPTAGGQPQESPTPGAGLAEVQRVRQFFPETWIWDEIMTGDDGRGSLPATAPDTITTWDLRAVAISADKGLGVSETSLKVFQSLFLQADLPYSAIRGEEFPVKVALYNYLDEPQELRVELEPAPWFDLLDEAAKTVTVAPNDVGGVQFNIRPTGVGTQLLNVTARGPDGADAVIKSLIVEPEGVQREDVENVVLRGGASRTVDLPVPAEAVADSARAYVAVTGSFLSQTIEGLDQLLQMPFGCGEQNMLLFAPDAYILKYLKGTDQLKPEIAARAEGLLITGYQRELTYRRDDGSFSAFGNDDPEGSLFLTAFVLKTFAQASDLIFVDDAVLTEAADWITGHQQADGSFEAVGFLAHQELMGGVQGKDALTAYVAIALLEAERDEAGGKAIAYLEGRLDAIEDPYALAITTYALELAGSDRAAAAYDKLMAAAEEDEDGLHWPGGGPAPLPFEGGFEDARPIGPPAPVSGIEATGYATLALIKHGDQANAANAARWLVAHRNALGGFGSTQDTVVALQALTEFAALASADVDLTVTVTAGDVTRDVRITSENFDVTQVVEVPAGAPVQLLAKGRGQAVIQAVSRYNLPAPEQAASVFDINVAYDTTSVDVDDIVGVDVDVTFNPPEPMKAGMTVLDVSVPTGFAPLTETLDAVVANDPQVKRYDVAGRKVILYIEDMEPGETVSLSFQVKALYPVRGKGAASQAYSYYNPQWSGETLSDPLSVGE